MVRKEINPDELQRLTDVFRQLGADDPVGFARSELSEGINQLAHFVFLKQAWENIKDEEDTSWIGQYINFGKTENAANTFWGRLSSALERMRDKGVANEDIAAVVQTMQYLLLGSLCNQLDDCEASSINSRDDDWPRVYWTLFQVDDNGSPIQSIGSLHEYSDSMDPTGREYGFRS
jgi:hypothetical protein